MGDCRYRILALPRHLSAHGHAAVAACELDEHPDGATHAGPLLEVDCDRLVERFDTQVTWHVADRRSFLRPLPLADGLEPPICDGETWLAGARCSLPARHGGECAP